MKQYFGTKVAYRSWKLELVDGDKDPETERIKSTLFLKAVTNSNAWPKFEKMTPNCKHKSFLDCSCGIYAFKSMEGLPEYVTSISRSTVTGSGVMALGEVNMWGRLLEHSKGWRAEFAYPKTLYCPEECTIEYDSLICRVAVEYGIPVTYMLLKDLNKKVFGN